MLDEKDLTAIAQLIDSKLIPINSRLGGMENRLGGMENRLNGIDAKLNKMQQDIEDIRETQAEHTVCLNSLIEWADSCREVDRFPLPKI